MQKTKTTIVSKGQDLKSLRHTWTCKLETEMCFSRGDPELPPLGLGAHSTSLLPRDSLLLSWSRAFPSALPMAAVGGNCCMSCSLQVCSHAVVLILLAFGPIQLRCEGGRAQESAAPVCHEQRRTSQHTGLVQKEVWRRDWFSPSHSLTSTLNQAVCS